MSRFPSRVLLGTLAILIPLSGCSSEPASSPAVSSSSSPSASDTPTASPTPTPTAEAGARTNPVPIDTKTKYSDDSVWTFSVGATIANATDIVMAENPYNESPAEGNVFVMAPFSLELGDSSIVEDGADPYGSLLVEYVTAAGNSFNDSNASCGVFPSPQYDLGAMYPNSSASFNACVEVPGGDVAGGTWKVSSIVDPAASIFLQGAGQ